MKDEEQSEVHFNFKEIKKPLIGYIAMVLSIIYSTLFIYSFIRIDTISIVISSIFIWTWGGDAIYLIYKKNVHGMLLAAGFIFFTIIAMFIIAVAVLV